METKEFWENKIISWEYARYSTWTRFSPFAWTVRSRMNLATEVIFERADKDWKILEMGCGSGVLARRLQPMFSRYVGLDIAETAIAQARSHFLNTSFEFFAQDISRGVLPACDFSVFLGLTDWLTPDDLRHLFFRLSARQLLFSFTDSNKVTKANPYRWYRSWNDNRSSFGRTYNPEEIRKWLWQAGYSFQIVSASSWKNPGMLIWGEK